MPEESLKNKTVKGVGWSAVDNVAQYAVSFVVGIVLARLRKKVSKGLVQDDPSFQSGSDVPVPLTLPTNN